MKKLALALLCLLLALSLTACGDSGSPSGPAESPDSADAFGQDFAMSAEFPAYAPSVREVTVLMENLTGEEGGTGVDFSLESEQNGAWSPLRPKEEQSWTAQERVIPAHDTAALICNLSNYDPSDLGDGAHLRIVKEINGQSYAAEFTLDKDSPITPETPAGFALLQDLPMDYPMEQAVADGCMVFSPGGETRNPDAMDVFLTKVGMNVPCQLRLAMYNGAGEAQLTDVRFRQVGFTNRFRCQYDGSRDGGGGATCMGNEEAYSFIITDGWSIYLSNFALWDERTETENVRESWELLAGEDAAPYIAAVQAEADAKLADNVTRYRVWNGDDWAGLTNLDDEFMFGYPGHGRVVMLKDLETAEGFLNPEDIPALTKILWIPPVEAGETEGTFPLSSAAGEMLLVISDETDDGYRWYGVFDPATETLVCHAVARSFSINRGTHTLEFES